jgi:hypothetical protein
VISVEVGSGLGELGGLTEDRILYHSGQIAHVDHVAAGPALEEVISLITRRPWCSSHHGPEATASYEYVMSSTMSCPSSSKLCGTSMASL